MYYDKRGIAYTASSQEAVDAFDASVDEFLASGRDAARLLKRIGEVDPNMLCDHTVAEMQSFAFDLPGGWGPRVAADAADARRCGVGGALPLPRG